MKNVAVVFGGRSCEHDISIITGMSALFAAKSKENRVFPVYLKEGKFYTGRGESVADYARFNRRKFSEIVFSSDGARIKKFGFSKKITVDCALLCTHGGDGENGSLQGFFEVLGIPYTSADVSASALCYDKVLTKIMLKENGFSVLPYVVAYDSDCYDDIVAKVTEKVDFPVMVKPASMGSSIGISKVVGEKGLRDALELAFCYDKKVVIEQALTDFTEINCGAAYVKGEVLLGALEKPYEGEGYLSFSDKYMSGQKGMACHEIPALIPDSFAEEIKELTRRAYEVFGLFGVVRVDFLVTKEGEVYLNEINSIPGSLAFYLFESAGVDYDVLVGFLIEEAIKRDKISSEKLRCFETGVLKGFSKEKGKKMLK